MSQSPEHMCAYDSTEASDRFSSIGVFVISKIVLQQLSSWLLFDASLRSEWFVSTVHECVMLSMYLSFRLILVSHEWSLIIRLVSSSGLNVFWTTFFCDKGSAGKQARSYKNLNRQKSLSYFLTIFAEKIWQDVI